MIEFRSVAIAGLAVVTLSGITQGQGPARRQSIVPGAGAEESTKVTLALTVGRERYDETRQGRCTYTAMASIYNTLAAMWSVQYSRAGNSSLALTVWRPVRGDTTAKLNFYIGKGPTQHRIATVKGGEMLGKGTVQVSKRGPGGRFEITGTSAEGATVRGYIDCEKFAEPIAVAGD